MTERRLKQRQKVMQKKEGREKASAFPEINSGLSLEGKPTLLIYINSILTITIIIYNIYIYINKFNPKSSALYIYITKNAMLKFRGLGKTSESCDVKLFSSLFLFSLFVPRFFRYTHMQLILWKQSQKRRR